MLFKKKHIEMILAERKTQTRRLPGKSANYSVGRVYAIRDRWFSKAQGYILITRKFRQKLGEISLEDIRKEGYNTLEEFRQAWEEIHGSESWQPNLTVTVYEFKPLHKRRASTNHIFARRYMGTGSSSSCCP
jgi:hypothetical protein